MNVLICDDIASETAKLEGLIGDSGFDVKTVTFHSGYDALNYVGSGAAVDACFLDIIMPDMSGIALAEQLRKDGYKGEIIFLSTSRDYGPETYGVKAFSYLLKPPEPDKVREVLNELENAGKKLDSGGILVKTFKTARHILFRDISHVEVISHYVYFRLTDGEEIRIYATFGEIAAALSRTPRFVQCHRSYIVNMDNITKIDEREITMRDGRKILYSRSYSGIKQKFAKWITGEGRIG